ncbi:hypothetical protein BDY21DRAFT_406415 [Lineolata rhizophorae]|uniref:Uncharacterized protein n=1 Tax=Lineolata rhizophorae TaxID=578093 RepID=A0A6A6P9K5_9PEZI|nr:hypothetical protein BDY21DRAFT_406415 [Lineolata rhizophorae]
MPLLSAILGIKTPLLRTLVPCVGLAYAIQAGSALPSIAFRTERFFDTSAFLTYLSCTGLSLYLPAALDARAAGAAAPSLLGALAAPSSLNWRRAAVSAAAAAWSVRLGGYLLARITADGGRDARFDDIRGRPGKFAGAFAAQGTWVAVTLLPVLAVNAVPAGAAPAGLLLTDVAGAAMWAVGFGVEALADGQKSRWKRDKEEKRHAEEFITSGLWGRSRHPNYFGEILLWTGVATWAGGLVVRDTVLKGLGLSLGLGSRLSMLGLVFASPALVTLLLTKATGIPIIENKYDKKYGHRADYQAWKENTPVLVPKLF